MALDPYISKVTHLFHASSYNGGTLLSDAIGGGSYTVSNGIATTESDVIQGIRFNGDGYVKSNFDLTEPLPGNLYTIEGFFVNTGGGQIEAIDWRNGSNGAGFLIQPGLGRIQDSGSIAYNSNVAPSPGVALGVCRHWAFCSDGDILYLYIDGTLVASGPLSVTHNARTAYFASSSFSSFRLTGIQGDVRVTEGANRYTSNFTPPVPPFNGISIPVVTEINGAAVKRRATVIGTDTGTRIGRIMTAADGTGTITGIDDAGETVMVYADDDYGQPWIASTIYAANAKTFATTPNGHWYQTTNGGTSGTAEPTWPTDGTTVTDGSVIWTDMGTMRAPVIQGPFIPVPVT